jgi:osmoprotectant transport system ATP-binding protein
VLSIANVSKRFGATTALDGFSLQCEAGRTTALIGPSGCGKSTLLRCIVGLEQPDAGSITFATADLAEDGIESVRRRIGYVIQEGGLFPHLDVAGNVALVARYLGWEPARIAARLRELADLVRLPADVMTRFPHEISGGQRQRAGLMRALMLDPPLLLLDEPLGQLDPMIRFGLQQDLQGIFAALGKTVMLVTHDLHEACYLAHHIVLMRDGAIVQQGAPEALLRQPADEFAARFVHAQRGWPAAAPPA